MLLGPKDGKSAYRKKVIDEQRCLYGRMVKAVEEAARICKDRNISRNFRTP